MSFRSRAARAELNLELGSLVVKGDLRCVIKKVIVLITNRIRISPTGAIAKKEKNYSCCDRDRNL